MANMAIQGWIALARTRAAAACSRFDLAERSQAVSQQAMANAEEERTPAEGAFAGLVEP